MRNVNAMVFPCGAEIALEIHAALKQKVNVTLWGGSSRSDHGEYVFANYVADLPYIQDPEFLDVFNRVLKDRAIDYVFPAHDSVALYFAQNHSRLAAEVLTANLNTCEVCREKRKIYALFADSGFCPVVYPEGGDIAKFPVYVKPNVGQGGQYGFRADSLEEVERYRQKGLDYVVTEYLPGDELSVDCFTDKDGQLRFVGPRCRNRTLAGISVNSYSVAVTSEVRGIATTINERLRFRGAWFFQLKEKDGKYKLLEVASRMASTMSLYRSLGVNFPLLTIYDALGIDVAIQFNDASIEVDRSLINRYRHDIDYDYVYVDFDDTLVYGGRVNGLIMMYLYQCLSAGKKIILITSHDGDIHTSLEGYKISTYLFDEVIHISKNEKKSSYVLNRHAIFIDNAFSERSSMAADRGIPVFDTDAVECLLDWKL